MMLKRFLQKAIPLHLRRKIKTIIGVKPFFWEDSFEEVNIIYRLFNKIHAKLGTMIDVGAHHGSSLSDFAFAGWKVFAFEPDDKNRKILTELYEDFPLVSIDKRALSDKNEKHVQFYNSDVSTGISGLSSFHPSHKKSQRIETITLRAFIESSDITSVDFLKIDAEGFDMMVLKGAPWEVLKPSVILCEFEDRKTVPLGYTFHDLARYLTDKNYHLLISEWYPVVEYGLTHKWRCFAKYPCELKDPNGHGNIIAVLTYEDFLKLLRLCQRFECKMKVINALKRFWQHS